MSNVVNTNMMAINAHRQIRSAGQDSALASGRLATGRRINAAADDPAGMAISEKMQAQIKGMRQAERNCQDAKNLIDTMDGAMDGVTNILQRIRELIIQGLNDTNTEEDRNLIQVEIDSLKEELYEMASRTQFNTLPLLNVPDDDAMFETVNSVALPEGPVHASDNELGRLDLSNLLPGEHFFIRLNPALSEADATRFLIERLDDDFIPFGERLPLIAEDRDFPGFLSVRMPDDIPEGGWRLIMDGGPGVALPSLPNSTVFSSHAIYRHGFDETRLDRYRPPRDLFVQSGSEGMQHVMVSRFDIRPASLGIGLLVVQPHEMGTQSLHNLERAYEAVLTHRATAGAEFNRLQHSTRALAIAYVNLEEAHSRIRDTDMALEMMNFTRGNVMLQASMTMLTHANQSPNRVLQLLQP